MKQFGYQDIDTIVEHFETVHGKPQQSIEQDIFMNNDLNWLNDVNDKSDAEITENALKVIRDGD